MGAKSINICQFWGRELMSLSQMYEERILKFSFFARDHFKAELYGYIYIVIFGKYLSELCWIVLMCFKIFNALLARRTSNIKSWTVQLSLPSCPYIQVGQERGKKLLELFISAQVAAYKCYIKNTCSDNFWKFSRKCPRWGPILVKS